MGGGGIIVPTFAALVHRNVVEVNGWIIVGDEFISDGGRLRPLRRKERELLVD